MFAWIHAAIGRLLSGGVSVSARKNELQEVPPVWLVVGLGNPDSEHARNRHNVGFMVLDRLARDHHFADWKKKFSGEVSDGSIDGQRALLLKPQTYMNRSGQSVHAAATFYKIAPAKIIVIHDELDLPLGRVRTKLGGGAAGHNGLKSIGADTGQPNYVRVRVGIGHPGDKNRVSGYVLSDFTEDERHLSDIIVAAISRNFEYLLAGNDGSFMSKISEETKVN